MGAIGLNPIRLDRIGLDPIRINAIKLGVPGAASGTNRPYIDPEVLASLKAVCICYGKSNDDPDRAVVKNLVDPDNPFVISNAAYEGMSGYNGYPVVFGANKTWANESNGYVTSITSNTIHITNVLNAGLALLYSYVKYDGNLQNIKEIPPFKIEIKGLEGRSKLIYKYLATSDATKDTNLYLENGTHELPKSFLPTEALINDAVVGFSISPIEEGVTNFLSDITIKVLPEYEGAFVTDGIDDLITSTKSATEMLDGSNEITVVSMIHQIKTNSVVTRNNWFFTPVSYLENRVVENKTGKTGIYGYTSTNVTNAQISDITPILGDKNDYTLYSKIEDGDRDYFTVEGFQNQGIWYVSSIAWYWTIIANKVLTTDQINQVIAYFNLDRTLKPDILCNTIKQGITNENHAEFGDKLIDFSGNGRDIQLNNIAWKGDSGIGKYEVDFLDSSIWTSSNSTITSSKIDCKNAISHIMLLYYNVGSKEYPDISSFKIIKTGADIDYSYIDETGSPKSVKIVDGVNVLPASHNTLYSGSGRFCGFGNPGIGNSVIITQIPSHAGALCLDGVDDFGINKDVPTFIDFTVIAKRTWLEENTSDKPFIIKGDSLYPDGNQNAFLFEYGKLSTYSFGQNNKYDESVVPSLISYATTYSYNGVVPLVRGSATDTIGIDVAHSTKIALYFLMLFPYSMSEFLIERQLKKHKLGTLYPDMVEWRPIYTSNVNDYTVAKTAYFGEAGQFDLALGSHYSIGTRIRIYVKPNGAADEVTSIKVNGVELTYDYVDSNHGYAFNGTLSDKSPQKINITIDEYIRFEDIVQPYPLFFEFTDENNNLISWGGKAKVGSTITRTKGVNYANLLEGLFTITNPRLNGVALASAKHIVEKSMVFTCTATYTFDNNEPKCILSPRLLRIPNSSYKILGYIPDISGHGNNGVIHNSAYAEGSGVNEDGSYQFDGVDDFVTIPTTGGGKQVFMKINNNDTRLGRMLYDQRSPSYGGLYSDFAIYTVLDDDTNNTNIAYQARLVGNTYIDGILNTNITCSDLLGVLQNITITCDIVAPNNGVVPYIGTGGIDKNIYGKLALYDFMLFDEISTDDKIKELNEYVGIEGDVWGILTQLSNSTLISNETLIKNE